MVRSLRKASCRAPWRSKRPRSTRPSSASLTAPLYSSSTSAAENRRPSTAAHTSTSFSAGGSWSMRVTSSDSTVAGTCSGASRTTQRSRPPWPPGAPPFSATRMPRSISESIISLMKSGLPPVRARMWRASSRVESSGTNRRSSSSMRAAWSSSSRRMTSARATRASSTTRRSGRLVNTTRSGRDARTARCSRKSSMLWSSAQWVSSVTMTSGRSTRKWRSTRIMICLMRSRRSSASMSGPSSTRAPNSGAVARTAAGISASSPGMKKKSRAAASRRRSTSRASAPSASPSRSLPRSASRPSGVSEVAARAAACSTTAWPDGIVSRKAPMSAPLPTPASPRITTWRWPRVTRTSRYASRSALSSSSRPTSWPPAVPRSRSLCTRSLGPRTR